MELEFELKFSKVQPSRDELKSNFKSSSWTGVSKTDKEP